MKYQELPNTSPKLADIIILPFSYEKTVCSRGGTKDGPQGILEISDQLEYYEEDLEWSPMKHMSISVLEGISKYKEVADVFSNLELSDEKLFITLGGEHSITPMITKQILETKTTVVFLDAHADLRTSYLGEKYSHATPAHHLLAQGHQLVMAGIRSIYEEEAIRIKKGKNITFFPDKELRTKEQKELLLTSLRNLKGDVYLSIDMDVFDPAYVPGVGTPQPGGMDWYDAMNIFEALFFNKNIVIKGVDIVELIPDTSEVSQTFAAKLLQKIISFWGKRQGFDTKEMNGAQMQVAYD